MDMSITAAPKTMALAVLLALAIDRLWGEPPAAWHPVVWMGRYLGAVGKRLAPAGPVHGAAAARVFALGALGWAVGVLLAALAALALGTFIASLHWAVQALALGMLLKPLFAWRMLHDEVKAVEHALEVSLEAGRARLAWLVSRNVDALDAGQVRESAIESLAENLNDSVIAPLFWFAVAGLPGAAAYRFANTADAMWGYRGERQERHWNWAGKWAARADDVLSWIPARLTAALLCLLTKPRAWYRIPAEARFTPSPNSGWPMAAMALMLGIRLGKPGVYTLHAAGRSPDANDTAKALRLAKRAVNALALSALAAFIAAAMQLGAKL
jgi:adenosylcobinamide-phosphate synthase